MPISYFIFTLISLEAKLWAEFHGHFQSFNLWLRNMDTEMGNFNPLINT